MVDGYSKKAAKKANIMGATYSKPEIKSIAIGSIKVECFITYKRMYKKVCHGSNKKEVLKETL